MPEQIVSSVAHVLWVLHCFVVGSILLIVLPPQLAFLRKTIETHAKGDLNLAEEFLSWWRTLGGKLEHIPAFLVASTVFGISWVYFMYFVGARPRSLNITIGPQPGQEYHALFRAWLLDQSGKTRYWDWEWFQHDLLGSLAKVAFALGLMAFLGLFFLRTSNNITVRIFSFLFLSLMFLQLNDMFAGPFTFLAGAVLTILLLGRPVPQKWTRRHVLEFFAIVFSFVLGFVLLGGLWLRSLEYGCLLTLLVLSLAVLRRDAEFNNQMIAMAMGFVFVVAGMAYKNGWQDKTKIVDKTNQEFYNAFLVDSLKESRFPNAKNILMQFQKEALEARKVSGRDFFDFVQHSMTLGFSFSGLDYYRYFEYPTTFNNLHLQPGMRILDIGSGRSVFPLFVAAQESFIVHVTDVNMDFPFYYRELDHLGLRNDVLEGRILVETQDARRLSYPQDFMDRITCISACEHIEGADGDTKAMEEIARVLSPGGIAIITVPFGSAYVERQQPYGFERIYDLASIESRIVRPLRDKGVLEVERIFWGEPGYQLSGLVYDGALASVGGNICKLFQPYCAEWALQRLPLGNQTESRIRGICLVLKKKQ